MTKLENAFNLFLNLFLSILVFHLIITASATRGSAQMEEQLIITIPFLKFLVPQKHHKWPAFCNNRGSISEIDLSQSNLAGTLDLLDFNSFPFLTSYGSIPASVGNLSNLRSLDLSSNSLDQSIPSEIGNLTQLHFISYYNNYIIGEIPYQIGNLQQVQFLDFGSNYLQTPDWSRFPSFPSLAYLSFYYNELTMGFPGFIFTCLNLTYLDISDNKITGQIPPSSHML